MALFRRQKDAPPRTAPVVVPAEPEALLAYVENALGTPGWGVLELVPGDRVIQPPPSPALPPMTSRAGSIAVRFRACQLAVSGGVLTGDEGRAVLARVGYAWRRADRDEIGRLRAAGTVLDALQRAGAPVTVGLDVVAEASRRWSLETPPIAPLSGSEVPALAAGFMAAFGPVVDRALELRDALVRGGPVSWVGA